MGREIFPTDAMNVNLIYLLIPKITVTAIEGIEWSSLPFDRLSLGLNSLGHCLEKYPSAAEIYLPIDLRGQDTYPHCSLNTPLVPMH